MILCVDHHSGYVVAVAACKREVLANEVAVMMMHHWLTVFGVPRTICRDRELQFNGGWLEAMCALMGIRHAKSVVYSIRSNGGAEVAGKQLFETLRRIHLTNKRRNWFEEMWRAVKPHHDTPILGGLSPHQILFWMDPMGRGPPLSDEGMAMDAKEFLERQGTTPREIRQRFQKEHVVRAKTAPTSAAHKLRVGDRVWVLKCRLWVLTAPRPGSNLVGNEESNCAFVGMKQALLAAVALHLVYPDLGFVLRTDASDYAILAILE